MKKIIFQFDGPAIYQNRLFSSVSVSVWRSLLDLFRKIAIDEDRCKCDLVHCTLCDTFPVLMVKFRNTRKEQPIYFIFRITGRFEIFRCSSCSHWHRLYDTLISSNFKWYEFD